MSFQLFVKRSGESEAADADRAARAEQMVKEWVHEFDDAHVMVKAATSEGPH